MLKQTIHGIKILSVDSAVRVSPGPPRLNGRIIWREAHKRYITSTIDEED